MIELSRLVLICTQQLFNSNKASAGLTCNTKNYHIILFQKERGVKMIAIGIGNNINKYFMYQVVGTKGMVILLKNFDSLTAKIGDILDQACGEWYYSAICGD